MAEMTVTIRLNQQQKDLLERTVAAGVAPDRIALIRLALRRYGELHAEKA